MARIIDDRQKVSLKNNKFFTNTGYKKPLLGGKWKAWNADKFGGINTLNLTTEIEQM